MELYNEQRNSSSESSTVGDNDKDETSLSQACSSTALGASNHRPSTKEPWVPAPGRTTKAVKKSSSSCIFEQHHSIGPKQSNSNFKQLEDPKSSRSSMFGSLERKPLKTGKKKRTKARSTGGITGYKLESKDSLIDVTATLKAQREEVLQLWQQNLQENSSPELLVELEKANHLALEATNEVSRLRDKIQEYKNTPKKLTANGSKSLEKMRVTILDKLREFEECRENVQAVLSEVSLPKVRNEMNSVSRDKSPVHRSVSQNSSHGAGSKSNDQGLNYIKRPEKLQDLASDSEEEVYKASEYKEASHQFDTNLNKPGSRGDFGDYIHTYDHMPAAFVHDEHFATSISGRKSSRPITESSYYREKMISLQRKLLDQEFRYDEMRRKLASVETKNDFDIQLLKTNMRNQIQELSPLPEMMEVSEKRLNETLQAKFAMENEIQLKSQELSTLKKDVERLEKELCDEKGRSGKTESLLQNKLDSAEAEIKSLRNELLNRNDRMSNLESQPFEDGELAEEKMYMLEDKIIELEHELNMERKHRAVAEHAKDHIAAQKDHQIAQLMNELESSRLQNQKLKSQLQIVKNSYHDMFSPYLAQPEIGGCGLSPRSTQYSPKTPSGKKENGREK